MQNKLNLYEEISQSMIRELKSEEYELFDINIEKRQNIIDSIIEDEMVEEFKMLYNKKGIFKIDKLIKEMLELKLNDTKKEIREYKSKMQGNNAYSQIKKENFNIFYKKV